MCNDKVHLVVPLAKKKKTIRPRTILENLKLSKFNSVWMELLRNIVFQYYSPQIYEI